MQYRYGEGQFYSWHNDAGLQTQYSPVSIGNTDGLGQDFLNENTEMVRNVICPQLSDYEGGNLQLLDEAGKSYIAPRQRGTMIYLIRTMHRVQS